MSPKKEHLSNHPDLGEGDGYVEECDQLNHHQSTEEETIVYEETVLENGAQHMNSSTEDHHIQVFNYFKRKNRQT